MKTTREVQRVITAHHQQEGAGFVVRRPLPTLGLEVADPFLLIDELGPVEYRPGEAIGAPDHPHRGFETVSYILEGEVEHEDSAGHHGLTGPGGVQWMTAGAGIVHSEEPSKRLREQGGRMHGFQIWVNLPAKRKMTRPRYQEVPASRIPTASADGATVRLIAGEALGQRAVIDTHTPIALHDWSLTPGAAVTVPLPPEMSAMVYVFEGSAQVGARELVEGQLGLLGAGDGVALQGGAKGARLLVLAGVPHREPVARYGPFVMNTRQQLLEAFEDYESGRMGEITRTAEVR
ncbi:MAG: pirin family protein [Myxococcota bacterium]